MCFASDPFVHKSVIQPPQRKAEPFCTKNIISAENILNSQRGMECFAQMHRSLHTGNRVDNSVTRTTGRKQKENLRL